MKLYCLFLNLLFLMVNTLEENETKSACESTVNPKGFSDCQGKETEFKTETCCYVKSKMKKDSEDLFNCIDVTAKDVETDEGLERVKELIKNGTYWPSYNETVYEISELVCSEKRSSGAKYLSSLFAIGVLVLLF